MKSKFLFFILLAQGFGFAMNKANQSDQLYSSLLQLISVGDYDRAYQIFNSRTQSDVIYPYQIGSLRAALDAKGSYLNDHPFYKQMTAFLSIYSDAFRGSLLLNEYVNAPFKKS